MSNASSLLRSLIAYTLCLPLAIVVGYFLATPFDYTSFSVVGLVLFLLLVPLLLRWHHVWLIAMWNCTAVLFFLPGKPQIWMGLAVASFAIAILQYTLNRNLKFLSVPSLAWPIILFTVVVLITARLTGGFGVRALGGDAHGGKRYFLLLASILGYFAIVHRKISPKRARLYVALFFLSAGSMAIGNLPGVISPSFNFVFILFPVMSLSQLTDANSVAGPMEQASRINGLSLLCVGVFCTMLALYGVRGVLDLRKPWRLVVFGGFSVASMLGGFRSIFILLVAVFALLFYLEGLHRTRALMPVLISVLTGAGLTVLFASHMPYSVQRSLSILPYIELDPMARMDAANSTAWRLQMWNEVLPQIPRYFWIGKGYSFSATEQAQLAGRLEAVELVGDYHNGPISVILPFGIFGSIAFLWLLAAGIRVVYQNYQFGDPALHDINTFFFGYFVVKVFFFFLVFGSLYSDLPMFLGLLAMSISLNGGVAKPALAPQPKVVFNRFKLHPSVRRPAGA